MRRRWTGSLPRSRPDLGDDIELVPVSREKLDLSVSGMIERVLGGLDFDALVNCAAYTVVDNAENDAALSFAVNAHAVRAMARVCAESRARLLHISTDYVFGGNRAQKRPLRVHDPTAPVNVYGASKAMGETLAHLACDDVVVVRVASLFGTAGAGVRGRNFVETVIRAGMERKTLTVVNDQHMSPTAAADVAPVLIRMLADRCEPGLYHVVSAGTATWFEFAREIVRRAGVECTIVPCASDEYPTRAARPRYSVLDNTKVSVAFGAMPAWRDALERYLRSKGHPRRSLAGRMSETLG